MAHKTGLSFYHGIAYVHVAWQMCNCASGCMTYVQIVLLLLLEEHAIIIYHPSNSPDLASHLANQFFGVNEKKMFEGLETTLRQFLGMPYA